MSLADAILARTRRPTLTVSLDGQRWIGVTGATVSQAFGSNIAQGTLTGWDPPVTPTPGMSVRWSWGYNGFEVPAFRGFVVHPDVGAYPNQWNLDCQDVLWRAEQAEGEIVTSPLNDISAQDAVSYILATYGGNPNKNIPAISLTPGGPAWILGTLTPVRWERSTALAAANEIARTAGYWLYADAGGTVRARQMERRPSDSPFRVLTGGDAAGSTLLVQGAPHRRRDGNSVKNRITVRGANTGVEGAQLFDQFLATHALYPGQISDLEYSSFLLEDIDDVGSVAQRLAALWNRVPDTAQARIKADPRFAVGMTVGILEPRIGFTSTKPFFIYSLSTSIEVRSGRFDQQITLDGGVGDGGYTTIPPPVAVIAYTLDRETLDGTATILVSLDGTGSYALDEGLIVSYAWSTPDATYGGTPDTATGPVASMIFPESAGDATIELTVTATNSKTDTAEITIPFTGGDVVPTTEALSVAFGAAAEATPDGGATWNEYIETITLVPQIGAGVDLQAPVGDSGTYGALFAGTTDLLQSLDALASTPTALASASGNQTALSVNVRNAARVWRAVGDTVFRSIDGGVSFTSWGTPAVGVDVVCIIEDPALDNSVFALAGADMYQSLGAAPSWGVFYAGPAGATARWMVRSRSGTITWIAYTGTFTGSPLHRVEGPVTVTFPVLSPTVSEIRALDMDDARNPASPTLFAADQEGRLWSVDAQTGISPTQSSQTIPGSGIAQHMVASQSAPVVYLADFDSVVSGTGAVRKWLWQCDQLLLFREGATGRQAHMVGLIGVTRQVSAEVWQIPLGASGGGDFLFRYQPLLGVWSAVTPPQAGWYWLGIHTNPYNANQLLLLGNTAADGRMDVTSGVVKAAGSGDSPLYFSNDAGATWSPITLNHPWEAGTVAAGAFSEATLGGPQLAWSESTAGWLLYGASDNIGAVGNSRWIWRGIDASTPATPGYEAGATFGSLCAGQSEDAVFLTSFPVTGLRYWPSVGASVVPGGSIGGGTIGGGRIDREPGSRRAAFGMGADSLSVTSDYRASQPLLIATGLGKDFAWATHGLYTARSVGPGSVDPVTGVKTPFPGYPVIGSGGLAVDRQTRSLVAWRESDSTAASAIWIWDGTTLASIPAPPAATTLANWVEVVSR
jgi:hypothetical protein